MSFMKSIILNCPGQYNILGNNVHFRKFQCNNSQACSQMPSLAKRIVYIARHLIYGMSNQTTTFVHEMGHALTAQLLSGYSSGIEIYIDSEATDSENYGITERAHMDSDWKNTFTSAAGPMLGVAF